MTMDATLDAALTAARACTLCADQLPHEPRPVVRAAPSAKLMIIGQAPGRRVHESGIPWNDPSGDRLRDWLGVTEREFYDEANFALTPIGFCYPGTGDSGDLPPRPECAATWHERLFAE
ncbi:MAG: uracil-DNA glycosylase family protein, partial [Pseudomonadota bacterium]